MSLGEPFMRVVLVQSRRYQEETFYGGGTLLIKEYVRNYVGRVWTVIVRVCGIQE